MKNQFDRIVYFVNSLERNALTEDQQAMSLIGAEYGNTNQNNNCNCSSDYVGVNNCLCGSNWSNNCNCLAVIAR